MSDVELQRDQPQGDLELVHAFSSGPMPTGISVSASGRIFVCYPKWGDDVAATVTEIRDGQAVPYPDQAWNPPSGDDDAGAFVSVPSSPTRRTREPTASSWWTWRPARPGVACTTTQAPRPGSRPSTCPWSRAARSWNAHRTAIPNPC
jgi:hypothetical protein